MSKTYDLVQPNDGSLIDINSTDPVVLGIDQPVYLGAGTRVVPGSERLVAFWGQAQAQPLEATQQPVQAHGVVVAMQERSDGQTAFKIVLFGQRHYRQQHGLGAPGASLWLPENPGPMVSLPLGTLPPSGVVPGPFAQMLGIVEDVNSIFYFNAPPTFEIGVAP